eukprot:CAMPEP_0182865638 /NCGR_PEP_ID=MMETSP0034_2-20130328/7797_1 /TAXON_ID=156128 /ORGANISM="Nephroselmis pyriformis, Strain CCMP717" /LENGTH=67 /DNA_ID=CAMNT_0024997947 /DNA_START=80 /DNA_END=283 /DNA_ORIENTATION=-
MQNERRSTGCKLWKNAVALFPEAVSILDAGAGNCAATQIASADSYCLSGFFYGSTLDEYFSKMQDEK